MERLRFELNGEVVEETSLSPNTTLLDYIREERHLKGTKEGCAEGDCGACTVVVVDPEAPGGASFRAVNSCLLFLPLLHGKQVFTVEALAKGGTFHAAQKEMVERLGSQCGYCTPGIVMSLFAATYRGDMGAAWQVDDQLCGNLCRCTGYRPIREAGEAVAGTQPEDAFKALLSAAGPVEPGLTFHGDGRYFAPTQWSSLFEILKAHPDHRIVAGATDLGLDVTKKGVRFPCLVAVHGLPGIRGITETEAGWTVGAGTPLSDLELYFDTRLPTFGRMLRFFGSRQIKNSGTLGGNLCNASPIGDTPPVMLALDATIVLRGLQGERRVPIDSFFLGYRRTALADNEVLAAVEIPRPSPWARQSSYKVSKRREMDISAVAASFSIEVQDGVITAARMAFGGMAATPARAPSVEAALAGQPFEAATFEAAAAHVKADFQPMSDHRGSAWYRMTVAENFVRGFFDDVEHTPQPRLADRPVHTLQSQKEASP